MKYISERKNKSALHVWLLISFVCAVIWSAVKPINWGTWGAEVGPAIIGVAILVLTYRKFRFSSPVYEFIWLSGIIMSMGGHYSYEHFPPFDTIKEAFHLSRNHFDRLGHIVQGIVVVFLVREVLARFRIVTKQKWLIAIAILISLANSAVYEILEFAATAMMDKDPDRMLGAQGDIWDSQWDMLNALCGACGGMLVFGKYHARKMRE